MKSISFFLLCLLSINSFSQKNEKLKILLDTLKSVDYKLTPNIVIHKSLSDKNIVWAGKIDTIEINKNDNVLTLVFLCSHYYFDKVSKDLICSKSVKLKKKGDGNFICKMVSRDMSLETANNIVKKIYEKSSPFMLIIGKTENIESSLGKTFVNVNTYNFYTFHK